MNYCAECGYRLEGEFKFCPNCGANLSTGSQSNAAGEKNREVVVCKNCGEENPIENLNCFSCGVPLKNIKGKKQTISGKQNKKMNEKISEEQRNSKKSKTQQEEKVLDNKKILVISFLVIIVFIVAMIVSGVFNTGVQENISQNNTNSGNNSVSLENLNEMTELENKIKSNPADMESTLHLAHLQQDAKFYEKAIENYKMYLEKNPKDADARVDMGICFYDLGDYTSAINEMETALKYQPNHQIACLNLGIVNLTAQNIEASKEWFKKAVAIDPNSEAGKRAQELLKSH
jgi:tetratricopeptide (TPR) repeat protein